LSEQIAEAVHIADKVRHVPARKVLRTALGLLPHVVTDPNHTNGSGECTGASTMPDARVACCG